MREKHPFFHSVALLAVPVALQSMLQSSFSIIDQIMIGQLGSVSIAGVGLAGKLASIFSVISAAVGAVAGIMISQYMGQRNDREVRRSFYLNLWLCVGIAALFTVLCTLFPSQVMGLYTRDEATRQAAAEYLRIIGGTFLPMAGATLLSTQFRCAEKPMYPLYASIVAALLNTGLNYVLIFGECGLPAMGARGAAIATLVSQCANLIIMLALLPRKAPLPLRGGAAADFHTGQYLSMLLPVLVCEAMWSIGENIYAAIYGHIGTAESAAMTLTNPVQGLVIGALCGLSQAAGVIIGKLLGKQDYDAAYTAGKRLMLYGAVGAAVLAVVVVAASPLYVMIYQVEPEVKALTRQILLVYAVVLPCKVLNMILGGGILRSGGRTKYIMFVDILGTWAFGVPLGLLSAFVLKLSLPWVYLFLSLEEGVRLLISVVIFRRRRWMHSLEGAENAI